MLVNGNLTNLIPAGAVTTLNGVSSPDPTQASLTNLPGVSVNKAFNPSQVLTGQAATLAITIVNTSLVPVVNMGVADNLPGALPNGLEIANPANATNTCGGTFTATPGTQNLQLTGGGLAAAGSAGDTCIVSVDVISTGPGVYVNTISGWGVDCKWRRDEQQSYNRYPYCECWIAADRLEQNDQYQQPTVHI
jgi:uncharacterized repeat protein (TIGR01451 family)